MKLTDPSIIALVLQGTKEAMSIVEHGWPEGCLTLSEYVKVRGLPDNSSVFYEGDDQASEKIIQILNRASSDAEGFDTSVWNQEWPYEVNWAIEQLGNNRSDTVDLPFFLTAYNISPNCPDCPVTLVMFRAESFLLEQI